MVSQKQPSKAEYQRLQKRIDELDTKVSKLQIDMNKSDNSKDIKPKSEKWKKPVIVLATTLAALTLIFGNILFWTNNNVVNTNNFVSNVGPLITKPPIQSAIATYATTTLFNNYDVQSYIQNALPPRASFLAPSLTTQVKGYTQTAIKSILANSTFQKYWYSSLTKAHSTIIRVGKNYKGNGKITVSDIGNQVRARLADTKLSFLSNKKLPANIGSITILTAGWLPPFHIFLTHIDRYIFLSTLVFLLLTILVIVLARRKMFMVTKLGLVYAGAMLMMLVGVKLSENEILSKVNSTYKSAAELAYSTISGTLTKQLTVVFICAVLISIVSWVVYKLDAVERLKPEIKKLTLNKDNKNQKSVKKAKPSNK